MRCYSTSMQKVFIVIRPDGTSIEMCIGALISRAAADFE